jgi:hypothetical protein
MAGLVGAPHPPRARGPRVDHVDEDLRPAGGPALLRADPLQYGQAARSGTDEAHFQTSATSAAHKDTPLGSRGLAVCLAAPRRSGWVPSPSDGTLDQGSDPARALPVPSGGRPGANASTPPAARGSPQKGCWSRAGSPRSSATDVRKATAARDHRACGRRTAVCRACARSPRGPAERSPAWVSRRRCRCRAVPSSRSRPRSGTAPRRSPPR